MAKIESVYEAKNVALDFIANMGLAIWSKEIQNIKKSENKWTVQIITKDLLGEPESTINLEIDADTGKVVSYDKKSYGKA